jgi:hypothetical protein
MKMWVDDDDERDDDKVLRHGQRLHIPMMMMDSKNAADRLVTLTGTSVGQVAISPADVSSVRATKPDGSSGTCVHLCGGEIIFVDGTAEQVSALFDRRADSTASQDAAMAELHRLSRPGPRLASDAARSERQRSYDQMVKEASSAWRTPEQRTEASELAAVTGLQMHKAGDSVQALRDQAYAEMVRRSEEAWKNP